MSGAGRAVPGQRHSPEALAELGTGPALWALDISGPAGVYGPSARRSPAGSCSVAQAPRQVPSLPHTGAPRPPLWLGVCSVGSVGTVSYRRVLPTSTIPVSLL